MVRDINPNQIPKKCCIGVSLIPIKCEAIGDILLNSK